MVRNARLPAVEVLMDHMSDGMSIPEIGKRYGVTGEAVRLKIKRAGITIPKARYDHVTHYTPWTIRQPHQDDVIVQRLRLYSKKQQGAKLTPEDEEKLQKFEDIMNGANPQGLPLSVHYDGRDPQGFWLEPRKPGDRDYISPPAA